MKTMQAVAFSGAILAMPAWSQFGPGGGGPDGWGSVSFNVDPNNPLQCEVDFVAHYTGLTTIQLTVAQSSPSRNILNRTIRAGFGNHEAGRASCGTLAWNTSYSATISAVHSQGSTRHTDTYNTPQEPEPETPEPETPTTPTPSEPEAPEPEAPPEPETPEPETPAPPTPPEPETPEPEPETPDPDARPVGPRCDHIAIVPSMPPAIAGEEGTPDHWLRITNPNPARTSFIIMGYDSAGSKFGTYRRELTGHRSVRVVMRDIEAAFDATDPEGWWRLIVTGSESLEVTATMRQGDMRRFVPVVQPEICESR